MAEARAAVHEPKVKFHEDGTSAGDQERRVANSFFQDVKMCAFRTRRQIYNGLWPTSWDNLLAALVFVACVMYIDHPKVNVVNQYFWMLGNYLYLDESYPYMFRVFVVSLVSAVVYFIVILYARQYLLRILLSYKGWLYEPPRSESKIVQIWALLVRVVSGRHPRMYSYQNSLPRMNVPRLKNTVKKLLESVKPLLDKDDYEKIVQQANEFKSTIGPKLQRILHLKSWWARNFCTDWWEKYVYLMNRDPIAINSNYYILDQGGWVPTKVQSARAAGITSAFLTFKQLIETEKLEPLVIRHTIPLCMSQYSRMFGTSRIPKDDIDKLRSTPDSEHIAVLSRGHFYKLYVVDAHGQPLNVLDLQSQFEWIAHDSEKQSVSCQAELDIAALTASTRTNWAKVRREQFSQGINKDSLNTIESAIFMVVLDDHQFSDVSQRAKHLLHGQGNSIWFDKSFNVIVFKDGKMGINVEHSWADAPVMGHLMEYGVTTEYLYRIYDDKGNCKPYLNFDRQKQLPFKRSKAVITPMRLYWDVNAELEAIINEASYFARKNNDDLHLCVRCHDAFGKGFIKTAKVSPDAFIQMALQLAYHKDSGGKFAMTYESSMTRLFLDGRTETVRAFTEEVKQFVLAVNDTNVPVQEKVSHMQRAADKHQTTYRDAMSGKGIDRHLFSLYIVCKGQGHESAFLKSALTIPWTLSTSQQPQSQMNIGFDITTPEVKDSLSPGGGFGPVSDSGYGISYMVPDDTHVYFHVSSKHSSPKTDSVRMMDNIFWAMKSIRDIVDLAKKSKK